MVSEGSSGAACVFSIGSWSSPWLALGNRPAFLLIAHLVVSGHLPPSSDYRNLWASLRLLPPGSDHDLLGNTTLPLSLTGLLLWPWSSSLLHWSLRMSLFAIFTLN
jgi:hypothetical protein